MTRVIAGALAMWVVAAMLPDDSMAEKKPRGDAQNGRTIFNGKGNCLACHGRDAHLTQRPPQAPDIARMIEELVPPPADLRKPSTLKSKTGEVLFRDIRDGHQRSAMFPKKFLTDAEVGDLVAYLLAIKAEVNGKAGGG